MEGQDQELKEALSEVERLLETRLAKAVSSATDAVNNGDVDKFDKSYRVLCHGASLLKSIVEVLKDHCIVIH